MVKAKNLVVAALFSGVVVGVFTSVIDLLPVIELCNPAYYVCLVGGGFLSAYLLKKSAGKIELKDGVLVGVLGGFVYAVVETFLRILFVFVFVRWLKRVLFLVLIDFLNSLLVFLGLYVDPSSLQQLVGKLNIYSSGVGFLGVVVFLLIKLLLGLLFYTLGGVLGAKLLEK